VGSTTAASARLGTSSARSVGGARRKMDAATVALRLPPAE